MNPFLPNGEQDIDAMLTMCHDTAQRLKAANHDRAHVVDAIERFLNFGDAGEYSPAELWDYFDSEALSIAECDEQQRDRLLRILSTCTRARYSGGEPDPPDWPWFEHDPQDGA